jgi:hypothetical protein
MGRRYPTVAKAGSVVYRRPTVTTVENRVPSQPLEVARRGVPRRAVSMFHRTWCRWVRGLPGQRLSDPVAGSPCGDRMRTLPHALRAVTVGPGALLIGRLEHRPWGPGGPPGNQTGDQMCGAEGIAQNEWTGGPDREHGTIRKRRAGRPEWPSGAGGAGSSPAGGAFGFSCSEGVLRLILSIDRDSGNLERRSRSVRQCRGPRTLALRRDPY